MFACDKAKAENMYNVEDVHDDPAFDCEDSRTGRNLKKSIIFMKKHNIIYMPLNILFL